MNINTIKNIEAIYFQVANENSSHWGSYGVVLEAKMVSLEKGGEQQMCFHVRFLGTQNFDFIPISEFGTESDASYWVCSYAQTQS